MEMDYKRRAHAVDLLDHPWMVAAPRSLQPPNATHSPFATSPRDTRDAQDSRSVSPVKAPSESSMESLSISLTTGAALRSLTMRSSSRSFLSRCVLLSAVAFTLPNKRLNKFREIFQEIDRNGNGEIGTQHAA
ncbi:hypothetical protein EON64_04565 [archaeon]|nr:MAG: hypothetical protein EON64_04565 [archaeon]